MEPLTDEALVSATLEGDEDSFTELVRRYQSRLVNYLYRLLGDLDEAHEVAQEVFFKVYQALDRFNPKYRFSTWIFRVAQNAAIDLIRKRRLKLISLTRQDDGEDETRDWDLPSPERDAYRRFRNEERGGAIQQAIDELPEEYRELIVLRHFGDLSYDEIATSREMPLGTVKNKLFRGRQMLKEKLRDYLTD